MKEAISTLSSLGGEASYQQHEVFSQCLVELLRWQPQDVDDRIAYLGALKHGFDYYYWKWDKRAIELFEPLKCAVTNWGSTTSTSVDVLCELLDFFYFVVWCFDNSSTTQSQRAVATMRVASASFAKSRTRTFFRLPRAVEHRRIGWLAMYAESSNPMSIALRHVAPAVRSGGYQLTVYAWRFIDEAFVAYLTKCGVVCHRLGRNTAAETIRALEARIAKDRPGVLVSDMNSAVPTAVFSRRSAPTQIFLQAGMPAWPVRNLDAVFNSFGFDPEIAGWGQARMLSFRTPWDLAALAPSVSSGDVARERAALPQGLRLVGSYGRFAKITEPYLKAAEQILLRCDDVAFVLGGTGDAAAIETFIAGSPVGHRMHVTNRFVNGHVWSSILDVFLDTWPVTGGESCREMIAKGRPVVTLHSPEMPAINDQRDKELVARDWAGYVDRACRMLQDASVLKSAQYRAKEFAIEMADSSVFAKTLNKDIAETAKAALGGERSVFDRIFRRLPQ